MRLRLVPLGFSFRKSSYSGLKLIREGVRLATGRLWVRIPSVPPRDRSSVGRAPASQVGSREFDSHRFHYGFRSEIHLANQPTNQPRTEAKRTQSERSEANVKRSEHKASEAKRKPIVRRTRGEREPHAEGEQRARRTNGEVGGGTHDVALPRVGGGMRSSLPNKEATHDVALPRVGGGMRSSLPKKYGDVAQLGERSDGIAEVVGSNPSISTKQTSAGRAGGPTGVHVPGFDQFDSGPCFQLRTT